MNTKMFLILCLIVMFMLLEGDIIVNETNCHNNKTLESNCKFNVVLKRPMLNKMECILVIKGKNSSAVKFNSGKITLIREVEGQCPNLHISIASADKKINKLSTICGGYINPINHKFDRFKSAHLLYDNKGLYDNITNINITFDFVEKNEDICFEHDRKFSLETWKIILIVVVTLSLLLILILFLILIIIFEICKKKVFEEVPVEEEITLNGEKNPNDRPDTNNDNFKFERL